MYCNKGEMTRVTQLGVCSGSGKGTGCWKPRYAILWGGISLPLGGVPPDFFRRTVVAGVDAIHWCIIAVGLLIYFCLIYGKITTSVYCACYGDLNVDYLPWEDD
jgi:hypothetical protein